MKKICLFAVLALLISCTPRLKEGRLTTIPDGIGNTVQFDVNIKIQNPVQKQTIGASGQILFSLVANVNTPSESLLFLSGLEGNLSLAPCSQVNMWADQQEIGLGVVKNKNTLVNAYFTQKEYITSVSRENLQRLGQAEQIGVNVCGADFFLNSNQIVNLKKFINMLAVSNSSVGNSSLYEE